MNDRDARLLPRLLDVLNTGDNERELGMAILQIRRILAADGKTVTDLLKPPADEDFDLSDTRHEVRQGMQTLGKILRFARHIDPEIQGVMTRMVVALQGLSKVDPDDVRALLACIAQLLQVKIQQDSPPRYEPPMSRTFYGSAAQYSPFDEQASGRLTGEALRRVQEELLRSMRRHTRP